MALANSHRKIGKSFSLQAAASVPRWSRRRALANLRWTEHYFF
jgi:hypothetical protein